MNNQENPIQIRSGSLAQRAQTGGAIVIPESIELMFLVADQMRAGASSLDYRRDRTRSIIEATPHTVQITQALAFYHPDIYTSPDLYIDPLNQLRDIQNKFSSMIRNIPQSRLENVLNGFPEIKSRIDEDKEILSQLAGTSEISNIELALKVMIDDSAVVGLRDANVSDSYTRIVNTHEFYQAVSEEIEPIRTNISYQDEQNFYKVGQSLLLTRRLFEINPEAVDLDYNEEHQDRNVSFKGHVSYVRTNIILADLLKTGFGNSHSERVETLEKDAGEMVSRMMHKFPERIPEIMAAFGRAEGIKGYIWTQTQGETDFSYVPDRAVGAHMSRAELISYQHNGD